MLVCKTFTFDAAHQLINYNGKCARLHGHTWKLTVCYRGPVNKETGMVIDFGKIAQLVNPIIEDLDHNLLNNIIGQPTCEGLLILIGRRLFLSNFSWDQLKLQETEGNYCILDITEFKAKYND